MKTVYLSTEEQELLLDLLQCCLSDLRLEITRTDHWDFKRRLRERKSTLTQLLEKLEAAKSEVEPA